MTWFAVFTGLGLIGLAAAAVLSWKHVTAGDRTLAAAMGRARGETARAARAIDDMLRGVVPLVQATADDLTRGRLRAADAPGRFREALARHPVLLGMGAAYEPQVYAPTQEVMAGDYAAWNYFQSVDTTVNERFVKAFRRRYGDRRVTSDPIEAAYVGVHLWAEAVETAGSAAVAAIRNAVTDRSFRAPGAMVYVDGENRHLWKTVRIGKIRPDGQFDIVRTSEHPIHPIPFPEVRPRQEWEAFLLGPYNAWGQRWVNPGPAAR
jgi:hypothetical protein